MTKAILYGLGVTIGAGIYVLVGVAAGRGGMRAPLAFVRAAVLMGFTAILLAEAGHPHARERERSGLSPRRVPLGMAELGDRAPRRWHGHDLCRDDQRRQGGLNRGVRAASRPLNHRGGSQWGSSPARHGNRSRSGPAVVENAPRPSFTHLGN